MPLATHATPIDLAQAGEQTLLPEQATVDVNAAYGDPLSIWTLAHEPQTHLEILCKKCMRLSTLPRTISKSVLTNANNLGNMLQRFATGDYDHATTHPPPAQWIEVYSKSQIELAERITRTLGSKAVPYIVIEYIYATTKCNRIARKLADTSSLEHIAHIADTILRPALFSRVKPSIHTLMPPAPTTMSVFDFWNTIEQTLSPRKNLPGRCIPGMSDICAHLSSEIRLGGGPSNTLMQIIGWENWKLDVHNLILKKLPPELQTRICASACVRQEMMATCLIRQTPRETNACFAICSVCKQLLTPVKGIARRTKGIIIDIQNETPFCSICNNTDIIIVPCREFRLSIVSKARQTVIEACLMCHAITVSDHIVGTTSVCATCKKKISWTPATCFCRKPTKSPLKPFACLVDSKIVISAACPIHTTAIPSSLQELKDIAARVGVNV